MLHPSSLAKITLLEDRRRIEAGWVARFGFMFCGTRCFAIPVSFWNVQWKNCAFIPFRSDCSTEFSVSIHWLANFLEAFLTAQAQGKAGSQRIRAPKLDALLTAWSSRDSRRSTVLHGWSHGKFLAFRMRLRSAVGVITLPTRVS